MKTLEPQHYSKIAVNVMSQLDVDEWNGNCPDSCRTTHIGIDNPELLEERRMKLKELLELIDSEEYLTLYVIDEDFCVTDKDGFEIFDKTDKSIKPYLNCRVTHITASIDICERAFIQINITRAD